MQRASRANQDEPLSRSTHLKPPVAIAARFKVQQCTHHLIQSALPAGALVRDKTLQRQTKGSVMEEPGSLFETPSF